MAKARVFNAISECLADPRQSTNEVPVVAIELLLEDEAAPGTVKQRSLLTLCGAAELRDYLNTWIDGIYAEQLARTVILAADNTRLRTDRDATRRRIESIERPRTGGK